MTGESSGTIREPVIIVIDVAPMKPAAWVPGSTLLRETAGRRVLNGPTVKEDREHQPAVTQAAAGHHGKATP